MYRCQKTQAACYPSACQKKVDVRGSRRFSTTGPVLALRLDSGEYSHTVPGNASRYVPGDGDQSAGHLQKSARSGTKRRQADRSRDAPTSGTVMLSIWAPPFYNTSSSNRSEKQPLWDSRLFLAEFGMKCRTKGVNSLPPACS